MFKNTLIIILLLISFNLKAESIRQLEVQCTGVSMLAGEALAERDLFTVEQQSLALDRAFQELDTDPSKEKSPNAELMFQFAKTQIVKAYDTELSNYDFRVEVYTACLEFFVQ